MKRTLYVCACLAILAGCSLFGEEKEDSRCPGLRQGYINIGKELQNTRLTQRQANSIIARMNNRALEMQAAGCDNAPEIVPIHGV